MPPPACNEEGNTASVHPVGAPSGGWLPLSQVSFWLAAYEVEAGAVVVGDRDRGRDGGREPG